MAFKWSAIGFTLLSTGIFFGSKPRIFQALAPFQVVKSWNAQFLQVREIPMTTARGGASQHPSTDPSPPR
ncbi:hypothetical protein B9479_002404 [Cryptococcus floricola]|uniref:Uncharacterized protein n=1 Tax=Cryptococcus floricola TaxID=2591691 RepID=A0A5D3B1I2_9TREE|nr:hypothetical protein B9479_002404 [Cryptococcus floricola]